MFVALRLLKLWSKPLRLLSSMKETLWRHRWVLRFYDLEVSPLSLKMRFGCWNIVCCHLLGSWLFQRRSGSRQLFAPPGWRLFPVLSRIRKAWNLILKSQLQWVQLEMTFLGSGQTWTIYWTCRGGPGEICWTVDRLLFDCTSERGGRADSFWHPTENRNRSLFRKIISLSVEYFFPFPSNIDLYKKS